MPAARFPRLFSSLVLAFLASVSSWASEIGDAALSPNAQVFQCKPGPWGKISWHYMHLEAPDWIVADYPTPNTQTSWCFLGAKPAELRKFLKESGIASDVIERWFNDRKAITKGAESVTLFPTTEDVEGLTAASRSAIYALLAKNSQNEFYANPLNILDRNVEDWLGRREIRPEIVQVIKKLTYLRGDVLSFSDMSVLLSHAKDASEAQQFIKLFTRTRAIMAYLEVGPDDSIPDLAKYWSAGYRRKDVVPMLESISQLPGGGRLGFSHLLPAQPRKLIYTYPTPDQAITGRLPDCHWTTLNFFNYREQNLFLDLRLAASRVLAGYDKVQPPYSFGDSLLFLNRAGDAVHSCTYLADNLVFTKNGEPLTAPWVIASLDDVKRIYGHLDLGEIQGYRRRWDQ